MKSARTGASRRHWTPIWEWRCLRLEWESLSQLNSLVYVPFVNFCRRVLLLHWALAYKSIYLLMTLQVTMTSPIVIKICVCYDTILDTASSVQSPLPLTIFLLIIQRQYKSSKPYYFVRKDSKFDPHAEVHLKFLNQIKQVFFFHWLWIFDKVQIGVSSPRRRSSLVYICIFSKLKCMRSILICWCSSSQEMQRTLLDQMQTIYSLEISICVWGCGPLRPIDIYLPSSLASGC